MPVGGPRNRRLPRGYRDTRGHDRLEVVLTFEGGGGGGLGATAELTIPQSFEANPLRGASQANGGRCCPHSYFLKFTGDRERPNTKNGCRAVNPFQSFLKLILNLRPGGQPKRARQTGTGVRQLTKRRSRTFITRPIARKTNNVAEPP